MQIAGEEVKLIGTNFVANIALPALLPNGLLNMARDPRKQRLKAACYYGRVEEIAAGCQWVKSGDQVVFERWEWQQYDIDDERIQVRERDLIVVNDAPMPDVMVLIPFDITTPKTPLIVPGKRYQEQEKYYHCKIGRLPMNREEMVIDQVPFHIGEEIFVEAYDTGQWKDGQGRLFFKVGKVANVLLKLERVKTPELVVIS